MTKLLNVHFIKPIIVGGRPVDALGSDYEAAFLDPWWVRVWPRGLKDRAVRTTIFNIVDCGDFPTDAELEAATRPQRK